jgi:bacterioferritin (cytochrome b1)
VAVVVNAEKSINLKVDSLNNEVAKRDEHIKWLNTNLDASDNTISKLRSNQNKAAKDLPTSETFTEKNKQEFLVEMEDLDNAHDTRNALCDSINLDLTKIVNLKDTIIKNKDSLYAILRSSFNKSIDDNYKLIDFSNKQRKKIRNKKIENYLLKVAIIAGGVLYFKK